MTIDCEESESEEEGDVRQTLDGADDEAEATPQRGANFDTLIEVFWFITGCNNGRGLSNESTVWLLSLLCDERLNLDLIRHWRTLHAVIQFGMTLLMSRRVYVTTSFTIPGWPTPFEVTSTSGKEVVLELFGNPENAEGFVLFPRPQNSVAGRVYTTPESATYWEDAQKATIEMFGEGTVIVPLILSSDATILSGNERVRVWAVYISIANIPLRRRWLDCGKILMIQSVESAFPRGGAGWNLLKVHLLTHLVDAICRAGLPREFSAAVYENAHIRNCKLPYRASNHRQPAQAIATHNVRASALAQLASSIPGRRRYQTALCRAVATGRPQLTQARKSLTERPTGKSDDASVFEQIDWAVGGLLMFYDTVMRNAGLRPFPAWAHTAVALPAVPTDFGLIKPHYARAAATLHGHTAFSCVEYESVARQPLYGRMLMLLDAEEPLENGEHEKVEVAVMQRLTAPGLDAGTGCQMLGPGSLFHGLAVIPIACIKRAVHCVPSFVKRDLWYLNKWAYFCTLEPY
ncbi:unnamed protein product [Closterium sp. NIES-54]